MAKDGTTMPSDAGKQNLIPSVPNPHQKAEIDAAAAGNDGLGAPSVAAAADNATDIPRDPSDKTSANAEVITGTGDQLPGEIGTKNLHFGADNPLAKGSQRYDKHTRSQNEFDGPSGADVAAGPGEEAKPV